MKNDYLQERDAQKTIPTDDRRHGHPNPRVLNQRLADLWSERSSRLCIDLSKNYGHVNTQPLIVFIHISKTAGSSFLLTLRKNYDESSIYNIEDERKFLAECQSYMLLDRLEVVCGHGSFSLRVDQKTRRDCCFITILREPLDRIVSLYYYLLSIAAVSTAGKMMVETKMTLSEFVQYRGDVVTDNSMTRMLCNSEAQTANWGECSEKMLEDAKHNLIHYFDFVGFTDEYADFSRQLCSFFEWDEALEKSNVNVERIKKEDIDPETVRIIREVNHLDFKLYEFAKANFSLKKS